jgi:hypothetical protein
MLRPGVFEASSLVIERILNDASRPAPTASPPAATQPDPPAGSTGPAPDAAGSDRTPRKHRQAAGQPVILGKPGDEPIVNGKRKARLSKPRFDVIAVLIAAGDDGLSKDSLAEESGHGDAHRILSRLAQSDPDWKAVIQMAGIPGGRYRIRAASLPTSPDISRRVATKRNKG